MSGFVVSYGNSDTNLNEAFQAINHRGPDHKGIRSLGKVTIAQNYLPAEKPDADIPVSVGDLSIGYDGQMGHVSKVMQDNGLEGKFSEEEIILKLYEKKGADFLEDMGDAIFGLVLCEGEKLLVARDLLGIKTVFYGFDDDKNLYISTELKSLVTLTDDINEFPAGHYMDETGKLTQYAKLEDCVTTSLDEMSDDVDVICADVRKIISRCIDDNVDFSVPTAGLLSGGMDSSVINYLASKRYKEKFGKDAQLRTYAIGVGESGDIVNARLMAEHIDSDHQEMLVDMDEVLAVLPKVIYSLEHFDPSLVRSSVANYLISRKAAQEGYQALLSGEGGDEIFCGYIYLKDHPTEEIREKQLECLGFLHNNASLRLDRMNQCSSITVIAPLISGQLLDYSLNHIHPKYKMRDGEPDKIEKWIFRKAYEGHLPKQITWRLKQEFSQGSGAAGVLPLHFEKEVSNAEFLSMQKKFPIIRSKEEMFYFKIFIEHFGAGKAIDTVGQWLLL